MPNIEIIPALADNYIYLIRWDDQALAVDPAEAQPVLEALNDAGLTLGHVLNTHHHGDHVAGNTDLKRVTGCTVIGPDDPRIPDVDRTARGGDELVIGPLRIKVLSVPGHTVPHIAFYLPSENWLLAGDSLFTGGCGRLFEGGPGQMHASLQTIAALPDETLIYCGHEYTLKNLEFAATLQPNNADLQARLKEVRDRRAAGLPTVPETLAVEKKTNPFLRVHDLALAAAVGVDGGDEVAVFAEIRRRRNEF